MTTRAKFRVSRHEQSLGGPRRSPVTGELEPVVLHAVVLHAVYDDGTPENQRFFAATPSGEIKLQMVSAEAAAAFELGQAYYVDFIKAEP